MFPFPGLREDVGHGSANLPDDVLNVKRSFAALDRMREPPDGFHMFTEKPLTDAIERFQHDRALRVDRFMDPGGETERNLKRDLGLGPPEAPMDLAELKLSGPVGNALANEPRDLRAVSKALGKLGLFNYDRTAEPPPAITRQLDDSIQGFQRSKGLSVDGEVNPGGETIRTLAAAVAQKQGGGQGRGAPATSQPAQQPAPPPFKLIVPKGGKIRNDSQGLGHFGAPRGGRTHEGVDITVTPGQPVPSPIEGVIVRKGDVYRGKANNKGLRSTHIQGTGKYAGFKAIIFYVDNGQLPANSNVKAGDPLGPAQDVRVKHGKVMLPHVHYKLYKNGKLIDPTGMLPQLK